MAYWLYCIACQQWSKSATPLSDDKSCSFCNKQYTNISGSREALIKPETPEIPETLVMIETSERPEAFESHEIPEEKEISTTNETPEIPETPVIETFKRPEASESYETLEKPETSTTHQTPKTPKTKKTPANRMFIENKRRLRKKR